ncbi:hypothetical protein Tco_1251263 [Tanacetum coccineum]
MCTYMRSLNEVDNFGKYKSLDIVLLYLQESNKSLCELRKYFEKLEEYIITLNIAFQNYKEHMILNDTEMKNKQFMVKTINNQSFEINDLKVKLQDKLHVINELKHLLAQKSQKTQCELPVFDSRIQKIEDENVSLAFQASSLVKEREHIKLEYKKLYDSIKQTQGKTKLQTNSLQQKLNDQISENNKLRAQLKGKFSESQMNHYGARRVSITNASGSKPRSNTKNDRISQPSSRSMKNKVEAHHRKFKSSANKNYHVSDCNANVKNVALSKNSDTIFLSCNECLFSTNHDACVIVEIVLWYLDSKCSKHMTRHRDKLINFVSKFIGTVQFGNDHFVDIIGYGDIYMGNILISRVYYVEGLGHNLFSVGKFCDSDLEVAFRKHTCFVRNLEGVDLLLGSRGSNLYTISMADMIKSSLIFLLSKASETKSWLWHR